MPQLMPSEGLAVLYALLHDIGKPILRYAIVRREGGPSGRLAEELVNELAGGRAEPRGLTHGELSERFTSLFLRMLGLPVELPEELRKRIDEVVKMSDVASAIERGLMPREEKPRQTVWMGILRAANELLKGLGLSFDHHTSPLLSPLWRLEHAGYRASAGPCATGGSLEEAYATSEVAKVLRALEGGIFDERASALVRSIFSSGYWLPVRPLTSDVLTGLRAVGLADAMRGSNYGDVLDAFYNLAARLATVFRELRLGITRGLLSSLDSMLQVTMSLVPSAVWATPVPDISLYAHSKSSAALAHVYWRGAKARLLRIEINGIQDFLSAVVSERAASRVIRGKSLLVELLQDSLSRLLLEFLNLSRPSIVVPEGGGLTILLPGEVDEASIDAALKYAYDELATTFRARLWVTSVLSEPFDLAQMRGVDDPRSEFARVVRYVTGEGALVGKARAYGIRAEYLRSKEPTRLVWNRVDALTDDVVYPDDEYWLEVEEGDGYADLLAPGKLEAGDVLSPATHISMVCGSVSRNLVAVVTLSAYRFDEVIRRYAPDPDLIGRVTEKLMDILRKSVGSRARYVLSSTIGRATPGGAERYTIGLVPIKRLGALHVLASLVHLERLSYKAEELEDHHRAILGTVATLISRALDEVGSLPGGQRRFVVTFRAINNPETFIPGLEPVLGVLRKLREALTNLGVELDIEFAPYFMNTYHPITSDGGVVKLKDLDEMSLVAVGKVDVDRLGEVLKLYTYSLCRLVDFSNLMTVALNMKAYLTILGDVGGKFRDVVVLYSGGDDISTYGEWDQILLFVHKVYDEVVKDLLKPLTVSVGVSIGRPKVPLLYLYRESLAQLRRAKATRSSASVDMLDPYVSVRCDGGAKVIRSIPLECTSSEVCFTTLARLLERLASAEGEKIAEYKSLVYAIGEIASTLIRHAYVERRSEADTVIPLLSYAYTCARREKDVRGLAGALRELYELPLYPDMKLEEIYERLVNVKPLIDVLLLKLRLTEAQR